MQLLIIGFDEEETRELSRVLRAAGHAVLGAQGRHGARTFIHAVTPDAIVVPEGPRGEAAAEWLADLPVAPRFVPLAVSADAAATLDRRLSGAPEPASSDPAPATSVSPPDEAPPPIPPPPRAPSLSAATSADDDLRAVVDDEDPSEDDDGDDEGFEDEDDEGFAPVEIVVPPPRASTRRATPRPDPRPPSRGPAAPALPEPEPEPPRELHPELAQKLAQVRLGDYFSIVEVEPNASTWAIREACERLGRRYAPRGWAHRLSPEELVAMDEIGRGIADALMVLGDEELRTRYQRALAAAAQGGDPSHASR